MKSSSDSTNPCVSHVIMRDTKFKSTAFGFVSCYGVAIDPVPQKIAEFAVEVMHTDVVTPRNLSDGQRKMGWK